MGQVRRRQFLIATGAFLIAPRIADAQQSVKVPRIGVLASYSPDDANPAYALREGLREFGYVEGKNIAIEWRWARGNAQRYPDFAAEMVGLKVDVIVAVNNPAVVAAQRATSTLPIVMVLPSDPIALGFVASFARPGANITGLSFGSVELVHKRFQLLRDALPELSRIAVLWDPTEPGRLEEAKLAEVPAKKLGVQLQFVEVRSASELDGAFSKITGGRAQAVLVQPSTMLFAQRAQIAELAARNRLPTMVGSAPFADAGCFMTYTPRHADVWRRAAYFVDRILRGAKPADLPVELPANIELVINRASRES